MIKILEMINQKRGFQFARYSLALMLVWFGVMNFTGVGEGIVSRWLSDHVLLSGLADNGALYANILGVLQVLFGLGIALGRKPFALIGAMGAMMLSMLSLTLLLLAPVWMESLGGFPAIGSGQGIIKYVAIFGVAMFLAAEFRKEGNEAHCKKLQNRALLIILFGLILVLTWIGGMKFTLPEAEGIDPLLRGSPFFSWITQLFDVQGASNFIGVIEIFTAAALLGWFYCRKVFLVGAALCVVTFLGTLSFLFTLPGWEESLGGFPWLSRSGHFLLKDLILLAGTLILVANPKQTE